MLNGGHALEYCYSKAGTYSKAESQPRSEISSRRIFPRLSPQVARPIHLSPIMSSSSACLLTPTKPRNPIKPSRRRGEPGHPSLTKVIQTCRPAVQYRPAASLSGPSRSLLEAGRRHGATASSLCHHCVMREISFGGVTCALSACLLVRRGEREREIDR